jgi:phosphatidylglycerol:prolipoprotein diacylglycerol transferase
MIVNNIDPVLTKIGSLEIRYYGIIFALGFVVSYLFLRYYIKKGRLKNLTIKKLDDLILYLIIGIIAGSRIFYTIFYPPYLLFTNPLEIFMIWQGGLAFHGGLIGAIIAIYIFAKKNKLKFLALFDALVIPASLGLAFGRLANYTNHELYGPVTSLPWCVVFKTVEGCRHPYQIYASITHFLTFLILLLIYSKKKKDGTTFWSFILTYGVVRLITDFFKVELKILSLGIGQWASLIMIILGILALTNRLPTFKKK